MTSSNIAEIHGFTDADLAARLSSAISSLRMTGREVLRQSRYTLNDGTFVSELYIDADPMTCAVINFEIADALVEQFEDTAVDVFSVACRPISDFAQRSVIGQLK